MSVLHSFDGWILFHCVGVPHFVYSSVDGTWTVSKCIDFMAIKNNVLRILIYKDICGCVFSFICVCVCVCAHAHTQTKSNSATPLAVAHCAPPSMEFSRQEYWNELLFPSPGDLPNPGIKPASPALAR